MWRRERPVAPYISAAQGLAMLRSGHSIATVAALVASGRERKQFVTLAMASMELGTVTQ